MRNEFHFPVSFNESLKLDSSSTSNISNSTSETSTEILKFVELLIEKLKLQQQLMIDVAENIGVQNDLDKTIFLACIWTMQPHLDDEYFNAIEYLKQQ